MSKQAEAGKGSKPRKQQDHDAFASGWDRIFGTKKKGSESNEPQKEGDKKDA